MQRDGDADDGDDPVGPPIAGLYPDEFGALRHLDLTHSRLAALPATIPRTLTVLEVGWNQLTWLPPLPTSLRTLGVSGNQLTSIDALVVLPQLQQLFAAHNRIAVPPHPATVYSSGLWTLTLVHNPRLASMGVARNVLGSESRVLQLRRELDAAWRRHPCLQALIAWIGASYKRSRVFPRDIARLVAVDVWMLRGDAGWFASEDTKCTMA